MNRPDDIVPVDLTRVRTYPLSRRKNKVKLADFARVPHPGTGAAGFVQSLPHVLKANEFREVVEAIARAVREDKPVMWGMGAHVIKCGLGPWIIELMERGVIQSVSTNGAGPIHDFEIALIGETSEDVGPGLNDGTFGMAEETGRLMSEALDREDVRSGQMGMGRALGLKLIEMHAPHAEQSVLANAARLGIPFTVHVGIGTDIIHMRTNSAGALLGQASFTDFRLFTALVMRLSGGGVYLNVGSSVILPEVFLKAFTIAQNLGADLRDFVTVNLDMVQQYRPMQNVVSRPAAVGGRGYSITGHHELMVPLLGWAVLDRLGPKGS